MPNIMLFGFGNAVPIINQIDGAIQEADLREDAIFTDVRMSRAMSFDRHDRPYIRICSTDRDEIRRIVEALKKAKVTVDVEWQVVDGFTSADEMAAP